MDLEQARKLYYQYETELISIDKKIKIHKPPYWWENSTDAAFLAVYENQKIIGFLIVGYGKFIDPDVISEICEIYLAPAYRNSINFKKLLSRAYPYLKSPWGFQVLASNHRAKFLFEQLLKRSATKSIKKLSQDGKTKVYKYRIIKTYI